jgi:hypothetical protein
MATCPLDASAGDDCCSGPKPGVCAWASGQSCTPTHPTAGAWEQASCSKQCIHGSFCLQTQLTYTFPSWLSGLGVEIREFYYTYLRACYTLTLRIERWVPCNAGICVPVASCHCTVCADSWSYAWLTDACMLGQLSMSAVRGNWPVSQHSWHSALVQPACNTRTGMAVAGTLLHNSRPLLTSFSMCITCMLTACMSSIAVLAWATTVCGMGWSTLIIVSRCYSHGGWSPEHVAMDLTPWSVA